MIGCRFFLQRVNRKETVSIRFMLHFLWGWSLNAWSGRICISTKSGTKFAVLELSQYLRLSLSVKRDFFTRKAAPVWLASTATAEARNAGTNIYGIRVLHQIQGSSVGFLWFEIIRSKKISGGIHGNCLDPVVIRKVFMGNSEPFFQISFL